MKRADLLTMTLACLIFAFTGNTTATADQEPEPFLYLPPTISPEATAEMRTMPDPSTLPTLPEPDDFDAWAQTQQAAEARNLERQKPLIERLGPVITKTQLGGVPVLDIKPKGWQDNGKVLVYTHGGAYTFQSAKSLGYGPRFSGVSGRLTGIGIGFIKECGFPRSTSIREPLISPYGRTQ